MVREMPVKTVTTFEDYLAFEETSQERHEFVDGDLFVMAGGTNRHSMIVLYLISLLMQQTLKKSFYVYHDVILKTPTGRGYYPDAYIVAQNAKQDKRTQYFPTIIIEVLSSTTEAVDRGEKWQAYQQIPSLETYILLSQDEPKAEVYSRDESAWRYNTLEGDATLTFPSLDFEVVLSDLYAQLPPLE